jgi:hypothetical protein
MRPDLMDVSAPIKPFRWKLAKREQLGELVDIAAAETYPGFVEHLRTAAARVLAMAGDSDLVFVGRSPECLFDYLSGTLEGIADAPSLTLMHFSAPNVPADELARRHAAELDALFAYFASERLDPTSIATYGKRVRFIDVVASGQTFGALVECLRLWAERQGADWNVVERRIGFVGLTPQKETSPNVWRWWKHQPWAKALTKTPIKNVALPESFWGYIANNDEKATPSHWLKRWASPESTEPCRDPHRLRGLRLALDNYDRGRDKTERALFVRELTQLPGMRDAWLRSLVLRLRGVAP